MKKQIISIFCVLLYAHIFAQTPTGFNYQAVLRNISGDVLASQTGQLRVTLTSSDGTVTHYQEIHNISTSLQGVVSLVIGDGFDKVGTLVNVPWGQDQIHLKLAVKIGNSTVFTELGNQALQAVPYALYAGNKEVVSTPSASDDEPIFVVRNRLGQIVFAVYQEGVRVYVDDGTTPIKGSKGGFAVGGLSGTKQSVEYFRITPDSARVYVKEQFKGAKGGFAVGGLSGTKISSQYLNLTPDNYFIGQNSGQNISTGKYNSVFGYFAASYLDIGSKNTFLGNRAGEKTTWGNSNVYLGNLAGNDNVYGSQNIFIGDSAGLLCQSSGCIIIGNSAGKKATSLYKAVFIGNEAGANDISGNPNTFIGNQTGYNNTTGYQNLFIGNLSGYNNTEGGSNLFIGNWAGYSNTTGGQNLFIGEMAGYKNTSTGGNTFIGFFSGYNNDTGLGNTFIGNYVGYNNTSGNRNTFLGNGAGGFNTVGEENVFIGQDAGNANTTGSNNTYVGKQAGLSNQTGSNNTYLGHFTGYYKTTGNSNVFIGAGAGASNLAGSGNVFLGVGAGADETGSNKLYISNSSFVEPLIYGEFDTKKITMNAEVTVRDIMVLQPRSSAPTNPTKGTIYFDGNDNKLKVWDGAFWQSCW